MVTIGDSFSIVATLAGLGLTLWSFIVACALMFPSKVDAARTAVSLRVGSCIGNGIVSLVLGVFSLTILSLPNPGLKLFGLIGLAGYFALVAVGASGISKLCAERIAALSDGQITHFKSFAQASAYVVIAGMLPILGWFLFAPLFMLVAGGAGLKAVLRRESAVEIA